MQLVDFGAALVRARLAVLFGAAVYQGGALFAKAVQGCAAVCFDADAGIDREPAVLVGQHLFGVTTLQQAPAHKTPVSVKTNLYSSYVGTKPVDVDLGFCQSDCADEQGRLVHLGGPGDMGL